MRLSCSFYKDHPELAPKDKAMSYFALSLTAEEKAGEAIAPVRESFDEQLEQQQIAVGRWRFVSPAIVMQEALTDLAGTGYWRYRTFREQAGEFKQEVSEFYAPKIHRSESLMPSDLNGFPAFTYKEEPSVAWQKRVGKAIRQRRCVNMCARSSDSSLLRRCVGMMEPFPWSIWHRNGKNGSKNVRLQTTAALLMWLCHPTTLKNSRKASPQK